MSDNFTNLPALAANDNRLLTEGEAAAFLGFTRRALQNWRHRGGGPLYVRVSARSIRYRVCDLVAWAEERVVANTSQYDNPY